MFCVKLLKSCSCEAMKIAQVVQAAAMAVLFVNAANADITCDKWFKKSKIKQDADCEVKCAALKTDFKTFDCESRCEELCGVKSVNKQSTIQKYLARFAYSFSDAEKAIIKREPQKAWKAYRLSWKAEDLCSQLYWYSITGDESDACRHYAWGIYLEKDLGKQFAKEVLEAHEQIEEPKEDREMDEFNNKRAIEVSSKIHADNMDQEIIKNFKSDLKSNRLKVNRDEDWNRK